MTEVGLFFLRFSLCANKQQHLVSVPRMGTYCRLMRFTSWRLAGQFSRYPVHSYNRSYTAGCNQWLFELLLSPWSPTSVSMLTPDINKTFFLHTTGYFLFFRPLSANPRNSYVWKVSRKSMPVCTIHTPV